MSLYDYISNILTDCFIRKKEPKNPKKFIYFDKLYCNYCNKKMLIPKEKGLHLKRSHFAVKDV